MVNFMHHATSAPWVMFLTLWLLLPCCCTYDVCRYDVGTCSSFTLFTYYAVEYVTIRTPAVSSFRNAFFVFYTSKPHSSTHSILPMLSRTITLPPMSSRPWTKFPTTTFSFLVGKETRFNQGPIGHCCVKPSLLE